MQNSERRNLSVFTNIYRHISITNIYRHISICSRCSYKRVLGKLRQFEAVGTELLGEPVLVVSEPAVCFEEDDEISRVLDVLSFCGFDVVACSVNARSGCSRSCSGLSKHFGSHSSWYSV